MSSLHTSKDITEPFLQDVQIPNTKGISLNQKSKGKEEKTIKEQPSILQNPTNSNPDYQCKPLPHNHKQENQVIKKSDKNQEENKNGTKDIEEDPQEQTPQRIFDGMVKNFCETKLSQIERAIDPYEYKVEDEQFIPSQIRNQIDQNDKSKYKDIFKQESMEYFCKFEFMKNLKKSKKNQCEDKDKQELENDRHFLLVKTWQKVCFQPNQQQDSKENTGEPNKIREQLEGTYNSKKHQKDDTNHIPALHKERFIEIKKNINFKQTRINQSMHQLFNAEMQSTQTDHPKYNHTNTRIQSMTLNEISFEEGGMIDSEQVFDKILSKRADSKQYFYIKTIKVFDDSINLVKEILVEMIPVSQEQIIDPCDTSTFLLSNKLFFFRRNFQEVEGKSEIQLHYFDFENDNIEKFQYFNEKIDYVTIDEFNFVDEKDYLYINDEDKSHKHLFNVIFSEEFGQHELFNDKLKREMMEEEKKIDEEIETELSKQNQNQDNQIQETIENVQNYYNEPIKVKQEKLRDKRNKIENDHLMEQFLITQNYYYQDKNNLENFSIVALKNLQENGYFERTSILKQLDKQGKKEQVQQFGKINQIFHIRNFKQQPNLINFLVVEEKKISQFVINEWKIEEIEKGQQTHHFDLSSNSINQSLKQWVPIKIKSIKLHSYDKDDQHLRIQQFYFIDQYNQIQLLFPLYDMKLEKLKIQDLIKRETKFEWKDPSLFKMIQRVTDIESDQDESNIFQSYQYLKLILPKIDKLINPDTQIFYVQNGFHQYMMINYNQSQEKENVKENEQEKENQKEKPEEVSQKKKQSEGDLQKSVEIKKQKSLQHQLIFYILKENDQFYQMCKEKRAMQSERSIDNIRERQKIQQEYRRSETLQIDKALRSNSHDNLNYDFYNGYDLESQKEKFEKDHPCLVNQIDNQLIKLVNEQNDLKYKLKDLINSSQFNGKYSKQDDDRESNLSTFRQHKVHIQNSNGDDKLLIKIHDIEQTKNIFEIHLLICQIVNEKQKDKYKDKYEDKDKYYQFVFVIEHKNNCQSIKNKTYFFLIRSAIDINKNASDQSPIISINQEVLVLKGIQKDHKKFKLQLIKLSSILKENAPLFSEYEDISSEITENQTSKPSKEQIKKYNENYFNSKKIKLNYNLDQASSSSLNFIPFVYQEADDDKNNRLIIFDIQKQEISNSIMINPPQSSKDQINEQDKIFKSYQICYSSEVEYIKNKPKNVQVKLSLATFFKETYGRIQIQEFLIKNGPQLKDIKIVNIKQIFFSKELIQKYQQSGYIKNSYILPFHLSNSEKGNKINGIQLVWQKDQEEEDEEGQYEIESQFGDNSHDKIMFINLLDQDQNNIYQYETKIACFGQKKYMLDAHNPEIYTMAICATLKNEVIEQNIFENMETIMILSVINEITAGIKIADLRYLMLNSFEKMKQMDFFKKQEILLGQSFCDICLKDAGEIAQAIQIHDELENEEDRWPTGSNIYNLCGGDNQRLEIMKKTGFYKRDLKIQQDYNFEGTIQKAIEEKSFHALKVLMEHVLIDLNEHVYQDLIMFNLRNLLQCTKIEINEFFERTITEKKNSKDEGFCNLEISFKNIKLPEFSEKANDYMKIHKLHDYNLWIEEIEYKIKQRDSNKDENKKNYEIEHSYIDFQQMIIGEKIRAFENDSCNYEFNDYKLCKLMKPNSESLEFYKNQTIQRIISYQWQTSKVIYKFLFYIYLSTFALPFYISQMTSDDNTKCTCLKICLFPMPFLLLKEIIYMQQMRRDYLPFSRSYGIILVLLFNTYAIPELMGVFSSDAEQKRIQNGLWNPNEMLPELLFTLILLSFIRLLKYIRVYDEFGFFINMFVLCLKDLETFIISFIAFLLFFTFCYIQLNVESMEDVSHAQGTGYFEDMFFGTYRNAIQELSMPMYHDLSKSKNFTLAIQVNIYLIWIMYAFQAFLMAVIFLNFIIGVISSTYNRVFDYKLILKFKQQASINDECFTLLWPINNCFKSKVQFKVLVFSSSFEGNIMEEDQFEDQIDQLKKFVTKQNKDVHKNQHEINKLFNEITSSQQQLEQLTNQKFDELDKNQSQISQQIKDSIYYKQHHLDHTSTLQHMNSVTPENVGLSPIKHNLQQNYELEGDQDENYLQDLQQQDEPEGDQDENQQHDLQQQNEPEGNQNDNLDPQDKEFEDFDDLQIEDDQGLDLGITYQIQDQAYFGGVKSTNNQGSHSRRQINQNTEETPVIPFVNTYD